MQSESEGLMKVISFLETLGVEQYVISNFKKEKLDSEAIIHANDAILKKNGLTADGDIIRIRVFCNEADNKNRKSELKSYIQNKSNSSKNKSPPKSSSKKLYLSWEHYDDVKKKFAIVRGEKGGGSRNEKFPDDTTKQEVFDYCVNMFWKGKKGDFPDSHMNIADHKHDPIPDIFDGATFTIGKYLQKHRMSRPRLYFQTRRKPNTLSTGLSSTPSRSNNNHERRRRPLALEAPKETPPSPTTPDSVLDERRSLIREQNRAFEEALAEDRRKEKEAEEAARHEEELRFRNERIRIEEEKALCLEEERLEQIRQSRLSRVPPELSLEEEHVVVAVRHPTLKMQTRFFKPDSSMTVVYDWVGSLLTRPKHFQLHNADRRVVDPSSTVVAGVYNMKEVDQEILMSPSGTVAFRGFRTIQEPVLPNYENTPTDPNTTLSLPNIQLQDPPSPSDQDANQNRGSSFISQNPPSFESLPTNPYLKGSLEEKRKDAFEALTDDSFCGTLTREDIYDSLIGLYKEERPDVYQRLVLKFANEKANGEGVAKDAFSCFFDELRNRFDGSREIVPRSRLQDAEIIGRIVTHSFILYQMFPIMLSKATLKYYLFDTVNQTDLLESFLNFLPEREELTVTNFNGKSSSHKDTAIRIFAEFNIFENPTEANITRLCEEAAHIALIQHPCFQMQTIVKGMSFFKSLSSLSIEEIYVRSKPTSEAIIENLIVNEKSNHEQIIISWLHRYIAACSYIELCQFLRFVTASASMMTNSKIKVEFCDLTEAYLKPGSQTCFCILHLPRQYSSFTNLTNNFNKYIQNSEHWQLEDDEDDE